MTLTSDQAAVERNPQVKFDCFVVSEPASVKRAFQYISEALRCARPEELPFERLTKAIHILDDLSEVVKSYAAIAAMPSSAGIRDGALDALKADLQKLEGTCDGYTYDGGSGSMCFDQAINKAIELIDAIKSKSPPAENAPAKGHGHE